MSTENNSHFIPLEQVRQQILAETGTDGFWQTFLNCFLFLRVKDKGDGGAYILQEDLPFYLRLAKVNSNLSDTDFIKFGNTNDLLSVFLKISDNTAIYITDYFEKRQIPAFVRNLFYYPVLVSHPEQPDAIPSQFDLMGIRVITYERQIKEYMDRVAERKQVTDRVRHSNFSNTASYMGNKRKIAGFIIEALFPHITGDYSFIDLMCGSGAMSQAFAQLGKTFASDAQDFCQLLAKVQGGGFTKARATALLDKLTYHYNKNYLELKNCYQEQLNREAALYRRDWSRNAELYSMYSSFVESFSLYSSTESISEQLEALVNEYKNDVKKYPYCLFTLYFSNVFFGLHQCMQLDSIRYAVDQVSGEEQVWALGVLVVTTYQISSGHANHFAQPKKITEKNITNILIKRQKSAYYEFSKRLICLSEESEKTGNKIELLPGPWKNALNCVTTDISGEKIIYLDAPYKRDEYSRYYHVLETMVKYDYPSSELKGRIRSKKLKERFATEFFTKNPNNVKNILVEIITTILSSNIKCVWSYSDNGDASIIDVINDVLKKAPCKVYLYGTSHEHQSQRGSDHKIPVTEYCIIFCPDK